MGLDSLFSPRSVAVIGASNRELTIGYRIVQNLLEFGFKGRVYPVNPKGGEIRGLGAYPSILDVPEPVDVAHIVIKNKMVPACLEDCAQKGVRAAIVNTAGFREIGAEGVALEAQLVDVARRTGIRVFGPNCQGIINTDPATRAYCNFTFTRPTAGHVSIVAQSGGVGEMIHQRVTELGVGVRNYASNGNACDISIPEIMEHYGQDNQCKVIVVHIESLSDPRAFLESATQITRRKPILAMVAGRTAEGAKAVSSHTGGMVRQHAAIELVFEKAGIVAFRNTEEMCQVAIGFASQPVPAGNRVGMITNTGGPAIIATDELVESGMIMPALSTQSESLLKEKLYPEASVNNPIDVLATAGPEHFAAAIAALADDDTIDAIFLNFVTPFFVDTKGVAREIAEANRHSRKPIVATIMTEKKGWAETLDIIRSSGVPVYDMPETGARVLSSMARYVALSSRPTDSPALFSDADRACAQSIIEAARSAGRSNVAAAEAYGILSAYGIPAARHVSAANVDECIAAADDIGYPVVLKVDAESILHKTQSNAVILDLCNRDQLREQADRLFDRFSELSPALLVQEQLRPGRELIVGAKSVEGLGHVVMFGIGGVHVEVLGDVSFKITPVTRNEAAVLVHNIRSHRLLTGTVGEPGVDVEALVEIIQRVSQMLMENPEIRELDINPIFAYTSGGRAADARIML